jgi:tetratricopeptide (TPR) repeat protein
MIGLSVPPSLENDLMFRSLQWLPLITAALLVTIAMPELKVPIVESAIAQTVPDRQPEGVGKASGDVKHLLEVGKQQFRRAEFKQVIATYQQVLSQPNVEASAKIAAWLHLGEIYLLIDQTAPAEDYLQSALKLARDSQDRASEVGALARLGWVHLNRQEYPKALETLKPALAIAQQTSDRSGEALSRFTFGAVLYRQGQYAQALEALQLAAKGFQVDKNQDRLADVYNWMAVTYRELKDIKQAEMLIQQQQTLSREIGDRVAEHSGLWTLASFQQQQKQMDLVVQSYQQQLAILEAADNPWFTRSVLLALGGFYGDQKQMPQASEAYQQALTVAKTIDDASVADVQTKLGNAYYQAEKYPESLAAYQQALTTNLKIQDNQAGIAQVWINIGGVHWQLKQYPKSIDAFQQVLAIYHLPFA